ncbi:MAG: hypothetical protein FWD03_05150 [Defluviitaleaceae bacterium]|nr:hypothetical protein [Defluviitaleaceae bacterium]
MKATQKTTGLAETARRAALRKADASLRHIPNEADIRTASEHADFMVYYQYQTINN